MQTCRAVLLTFFLGNVAVIAGPILTAPGSGAFEYTFAGNTVAQFGATGLVVPGDYRYPSSALFPFPPVLDEELFLSSTGVWTFYSRFTLCCWSTRVLTPAISQIPEPGVTTYNSVIDNVYDTGQVVRTETVPGSARLTISSTPEPATLVTAFFGFVMMSLFHLRLRDSKRHPKIG